MEPSLADYLNMDEIYDSDQQPDPASPATLAMSPFSSMADGTSTVGTIAYNDFADPMDFPMMCGGDADNARINDIFSPFALTAPFPDFTAHGQDQGAQATLMQSQQEPVAQPTVDIATLLQQYNKVVPEPSKSIAPVQEPLAVVKQEPADDVLMSIDESARSSGISPAALFGGNGSASVTVSTSTARDLSALYSAPNENLDTFASDDEDEAHEAVTPSESPSAAHAPRIAIADSRKSSVGFVAAVKRARESDGEQEKSNVKTKTNASTPFRELSVNQPDAGFDASGSRIDLDTLKPLPLPSMFGGIKGKGGKKGGGLSSVVLEDPTEAGEDDDWRPTPEEYKKLSSKEKRQLRNKLSARAFRTRRKTYINELEDHIKDRDRLIDAIKAELMTSRSENDELRREIDAMKKAAMAPVPSSLKEMTPAPASALIAGLGMTANAKSSNSSSQINTYNPHKDVSGSTAAALSAMPPKFWGASTPLGGNYTSCHTTFVPDLVLPGASPLTSPSLSTTSSYSSASTSASASPCGFARANLNPLLNDKKPVTESTSPTGTSVVSLATPCDGSDLSDSFGNWSADNGFTWNNLDAYRMQLWSRMARDASFARQGVPQDMRPKFLRESTSNGALVHPHHKATMGVNEALSPVGYAAPPPTYRESHDDPTPTITQIIQHTISSRLFSSFLGALKMPASPNASARFDNDKIMDIVQGKATLGVVPTDPPAYTEKRSPARDKFDVDAEYALAMSFNNLKLATENMARSKSQEENVGMRVGVSVGSRG